MKLEHIPREENTAAVSLSRLAFDRNLNINNAIFTIQIDDKVFPLDMRHIGKKQLTDELLKKNLKDLKLEEYFGKMKFDNIKVITFKEKVWVPKDLQLHLIDWYHETLGLS